MPGAEDVVRRILDIFRTRAPAPVMIVSVLFIAYGIAKFVSALGLGRSEVGSDGQLSDGWQGIVFSMLGAPGFLWKEPSESEARKEAARAIRERAAENKARAQSAAEPHRSR